MIPSILCYVPPSVELLRPTTSPVFKPGPKTSPAFSNQIDASGPICELANSTLILMAVAYSYAPESVNRTV